MSWLTWQLSVSIIENVDKNYIDTIKNCSVLRKRNENYVYQKLAFYYHNFEN